MNLTNTNESYGLISIAFHWIMALLMIGLLYVGLTMPGLEPNAFKWQIYGLHKALGITVLGLVIARIIWMHIAKRPKPIETQAKWEHILAKIVHVLLYIGMIGMPLSGWIMSSAGGHAVSFFGLFEMPAIVDKDPQIGKLAHEIHEYAGFALIGAILLHFAGALKHKIIDKDATLSRMIPLCKKKSDSE